MRYTLSLTLNQMQAIEKYLRSSSAQVDLEVEERAEVLAQISAQEDRPPDADVEEAPQNILLDTV